MATATHIRHSVLAALIVFVGCRPAADQREAVRLYNDALAAQYRDPAAALSLADRGLAIWREQTASLWRWRFRLLKAQLLLAQGKAKDANPLLQGDVPAIPEQRSLAARLALERGHAAYLRGDYPASRKFYNSALSSARAIGADTIAAEALLRGAALSLRQGAMADAEADLRQAEPYANRDRNQYLRASILGMRGVLLMQRSYYDAAIPWSQQALDLSIKEHFSALIPPMIGDLAFCYYRLGDLDKALSTAERAESLYRDLHLPMQEQIDLGTIGNIHYVRRETPQAISAYTRALKIASDLNDDYWRAKWLNNLALALIDSGDLARASAYNDQALQLQRARKDQRAIAFPELNSARIAAAKADFSTARSVLDTITHSTSADPTVQWDAHLQLARVYQATGQPKLASAEFERAASNIEQARARLEQDYSKLTLLARYQELYDLYVDFLASQGKADEALEIVESSRARVMAEKLGVTPMRSARAADFITIARKRHCTILSYWLAPKRSFLWVVTGGGIRMFELPPSEQLRALIEQHAGQINSARDPVQISGSAGARLYQVLIKPAAALIGRNGRVIVVPDRALHEINLETLVNEAPSPHYWLNDVSLSLAPSISLIKTAGDAPLLSASVLLVGAPLTSASNVPALPGARAEIDGIARSFPDSRATTVLTGANATPARYRQSEPGHFSLIHFAAHTEINPASPLDSAILLSPGEETYKLYAHDLQSSPLHAELVTLSACRGAGARMFPGEGLVGLTWALLQAGAQNVIAGLWNVPDASTAHLMADLYNGLARRSTPVEALRAAKLHIIQSSPSAKPYDWAAFQVYGR